MLLAQLLGVPMPDLRSTFGRAGTQSGLGGPTATTTGPSTLNGDLGMSPAPVIAGLALALGAQLRFRGAVLVAGARVPISWSGGGR